MAEAGDKCYQAALKLPGDPLSAVQVGIASIGLLYGIVGRRQELRWISMGKRKIPC